MREAVPHPWPLNMPVRLRSLLLLHRHTCPLLMVQTCRQQPHGLSLQVSHSSLLLRKFNCILLIIAAVSCYGCSALQVHLSLSYEVSPTTLMYNGS